MHLEKKESNGNAENGVERNYDSGDDHFPIKYSRNEESRATRSVKVDIASPCVPLDFDQRAIHLPR